MTGASSGIGLALARRLDAQQADLLAVGRRGAAGLPPDFPKIAYQPLDISVGDAGSRLAEMISARGWNGLDLVIHSAGTGYCRPVATDDAASIAATVATNCLGPIALTHALAPHLAKAGGTAVFVGSAAQKGAPGFPVYAATKGALAGFARALRSEWRGRIGVQILHPGPTETAMHDRAGHDPGRLRALYLNADDVAAVMLRQIAGGRSPRNTGHAAIWCMRGVQVLAGGR
ncbi:MAG TPA: SDR family NAD(P)-dependent oxidoreductase [Afifellaceae bacterium]|nr:SDR family NAD(P)-dependent oxidoreductase [Afifellaceae bacterium]